LLRDNDVTSAMLLVQVSRNGVGFLYRDFVDRRDNRLLTFNYAIATNEFTKLYM